METLVAYITGLFDGEGCVSSQEHWISGKYEKYPRITIQVSITNQNKECLNLVRGIFGGTIYRHSGGKGIYPPCYVWKICGKEKMINFFSKILPYAVIKKGDIQLGLEFSKTLREENLGCNALSKEIHELRLRIHHSLQKRKSAKAPHIRNGMKQRIEIAGTSRTDNPQGSLRNEEPSTTIMVPPEKVMG